MLTLGYYFLEREIDVIYERVVWAVVLTVGVVVRGVVVPHVLVRREVRGVLLQAAAARHVAQPVPVAALAAAVPAAAAAAAAEHPTLSNRDSPLITTQAPHTILVAIDTCGQSQNTVSDTHRKT